LFDALEGSVPLTVDGTLKTEFLEEKKAPGFFPRLFENMTF
jgi:hypothetical protein